jgi:hypothetical protein
MQAETNSEAAERICRYLEQEVRAAGTHGPLLLELILHELVERLMEDEINTRSIASQIPCFKPGIR